MSFKVHITKAAKPKILGIKPLREPKEPKEPIQRFFITYTDKSVILTFGEIKMGLKLENSGLQIIHHKVSQKEQAEAIKITNLMKLLKKSNVSFQDIAKRLEPGIYATSLKQFNNRINKPVETT